MLSHDYEWNDEEHGYSPKCINCHNCDHYDDCIYDMIYYEVVYPLYVLCHICDINVTDKEQYLFTSDMKTNYYEQTKDLRNGKGLNCLSCQSERTWPTIKRVCMSCYLQLSETEQYKRTRIVSGFGADKPDECYKCHALFSLPSPRQIVTVDCKEIQYLE